MYLPVTLKCTQVSALVFYAQLIKTVISGQMCTAPWHKVSSYIKNVLNSVTHTRTGSVKLQAYRDTYFSVTLKSAQDFRIKHSATVRTA